jgi:GntR family transcriptional regulator
MFKRSPSLPEQVKSHLKQRIINAEFEAGRIPSEADLAHELSVSRNTIREALSRLEMEGIIFRRQGAGTFINEAVRLVKTRLEDIIPYESLIQEHGYIPSIHLVDVAEQSADDRLKDILHLRSNEKVLRVQKLFRADNEPVIFTVTNVPTRIIKRPYALNDFHMPIYQFLPIFCQLNLAYYLTEIVPLIAVPSLIDILALPQQETALLSFEEIGYSQENEPIVKACSYFRDDLLRLRLIRRHV